MDNKFVTEKKKVVVTCSQTKKDRYIGHAEIVTKFTSMSNVYKINYLGISPLFSAEETDVNSVI